MNSWVMVSAMRTMGRVAPLLEARALARSWLMGMPGRVTSSSARAGGWGGDGGQGCFSGEDDFCVGCGCEEDGFDGG